jgi:hypothetical protein
MELLSTKSRKQRKAYHFTVNISYAGMVTCFIIQDYLLEEGLIRYKMALMKVYPRNSGEGQ